MQLARSFRKRRDPFFDRRAADRTYADIEACYLGEDDQQVPCRILDLSLTGACVRVDDPSRLPDIFLIRLAESGQTFLAQIRWRDYTDAGVLFLDPDPDGSAD